MVLKATLQEESPEQSLPKVSSEAAVRRCSSKFPNTHRKTSVLESFFNKKGFIQKRLFSCFLVNIAKFLETAFVIEHLRCHLSTFSS